MSPNCWQEFRLKDLVLGVRNGVWGAEPGVDVDTWCIRGTDFDRIRNRVDITRAPRRSVAADVLRQHRLMPGDLILEKSGGSADQPVGSVALFDLEDEAVTSNFNARMRIATGVDPGFACYLFNGLYASGVTKQFVKQVTGIQNLDTAAFLAWRCRLPEILEQHRIVDFLDRQTEGIDRTILLHSELRQVLQRRFQAQRDLLVEDAARECGTLPLRRYLLSTEQGVSPQCDNVEAHPGEWGVIKVSAVKGGRFLSGENKRLPSTIRPELQFRIRVGDLLVTRANTPVLVGGTAVVEELGRDLLLCDKIFRLRTSVDLDSHFLLEVAMTSRVRAMCVEAAHGTSQSMANLRIDEIKRWPIPVVTRHSQQEIVGELRDARDQLNSLVVAIDRQLDLLAERRGALIAAAVTGQIDVSTASGVAV